jgi:CheY-like chemotaxis protein
MNEALKPLVLIVDDEPQIRRLLRVTLEANGPINLGSPLWGHRF